jgi:hypothetical protein
MDGATGICVPSCASDDECASGYCDPSDGSCYFSPDMPMPDAGTPDAGTMDVDAGTPDAGTMDVDAGTPASDAGAPDTDGAVVADPDSGPPV